MLKNFYFDISHLALTVSSSGDSFNVGSFVSCFCCVIGLHLLYIVTVVTFNLMSYCSHCSHTRSAM